MNKRTSSLYYSRTETDDSIEIIWKPFTSLTPMVLVVIALLGSFVNPFISILSFILLLANAILYIVICKKPREEINEASQKSGVQVKGRKLSLASPLTITIPKNSGFNASDINSESPMPSSYTQQKKPSTTKKIIFSILAAIFLFIGLFILSAAFSGIRQAFYLPSVMLLLGMALVFLLLAFLCYRILKK